MPMPFSNDLRKRIIEYYEEGKSVKELTKMFRVGKTAVYNLITLYKETESYEPREHKRGRKPGLTEEQFRQVEELIKEEPDIELHSIKERLSLPISVPALCNIVNYKLELKRKKNAISKGATTRRC